MSDVVYVSKARIERKQGPLVRFRVHGAVAEHYKIDAAAVRESHASTLDYVIAATAG